MHESSALFSDEVDRIDELGEAIDVGRLCWTRDSVDWRTSDGVRDKRGDGGIRQPLRLLLSHDAAAVVLLGATGDGMIDNLLLV